MPPFTSQLQQWINGFPDLVSRLLLAAGIVLATLLISAWVARAVASAARRQDAAPSVQSTLRRLTRWGILVLGGVLALEQVIPNVTSLLAGLGIAGFTIGFALQDVAKNLIAGILLLLQQPFEVGDTIQVSDFTGTVLDVSLRTTDLRSADGLFVTIPNADVLANPILNYSRAPARRLQLSLGLAYGTDLQRAEELALQALTPLTGLLDDPAPQVIFNALGGSAIELTIYYWADMSATGYNEALDAGVRAVKQAFEDAGIDVSPPSMAIMLASS
ncbi:MAG: mechanosensitive ion channel family protein [Anaerolineales bacterium]